MSCADLLRVPNMEPADEQTSLSADSHAWHGKRTMEKEYRAAANRYLALAAETADPEIASLFRALAEDCLAEVVLEIIFAPNLNLVLEV